MGYTVKRKSYHLKFVDPEMGGLEVVAHSGSTGNILNIMEQETDGRIAEAVKDSMAVFADNLVSWNLEDEQGQPVPANLDGLKTLDLDFVMLLIQGWVQSVQDVPAPLETPSTSGKPFQEASLPMEAL